MHGSAPVVTLPDFRSTEHATAFGSEMTAADYDAAERERAELKQRFEAETSTQAKVFLACRLQLLRECCEAFDIAHRELEVGGS